MYIILVKQPKLLREFAAYSMLHHQMLLGVTGRHFQTYDAMETVEMIDT